MVVSSADLSANHATIVEWSEPIYWPNVPIRQDFRPDLSANHNQRVKFILTANDTNIFILGKNLYTVFDTLNIELANLSTMV